MAFGGTSPSIDGTNRTVTEPSSSRSAVTLLTEYKPCGFGSKNPWLLYTDTDQNASTGMSRKDIW